METKVSQNSRSQGRIRTQQLQGIRKAFRKHYFWWLQSYNFWSLCHFITNLGKNYGPPWIRCLPERQASGTAMKYKCEHWKEGLPPASSCFPSRGVRSLVIHLQKAPVIPNRCFSFQTFRFTLIYIFNNHTAHFILWLAYCL